MSEPRVTNLGGLLNVLQTFRSDHSWIFRGQAMASGPLVPKAGRAPFNRTDDWHVLRLWKQEAVGLIHTIPSSDWEWLALAQHHGLATRLLDWTRNALSAAYFAVADPNPGEAVIFAARVEPRVIPEEYGPTDFAPNEPSVVPRIYIFRPPAIVPRIVRQAGVFTFHVPRDLVLTPNAPGVLSVETIPIDADARSEIRRDLSAYGVNRKFLFPDLDGLAVHINWEMEAGEFFA